MSEDFFEEYMRARSKAMLQVGMSFLKREDLYVPVLEDVLKNHNDITINKKPYYGGFVSVKSIIGVYDSGRRKNFASNFMPLPKKREGDFANKWARVEKTVPSWLESGNKIKLFEFLHDLYVAEGNRRVSVAKYKDIPFVDATITRIIPSIENASKEVKLYHDFLEFEKRTKISNLWFGAESKYDELEEYANFYAESYKGDYSDFFKDVFYPFKNAFNKLSDNRHQRYVGDIFLIYLREFDLNKKDDYKLKDFNKLTRKAMRVFDKK